MKANKLLKWRIVETISIADFVDRSMYNNTGLIELKVKITEKLIGELTK